MTNMTNPQMEAAIREIQDAMVVMAHLEKEQSERIAQHHADLKVARDRCDRIEKNFERLQLTVAEIGDKLDGLIGYMDNQKRQ
jgi:hypothetical protein